MIDEQNLEKKFLSLTNSQESIQTLSLWVLHHKNHYKKIIQVWFKILEKDKIPHRLTLFYLANDVVQHAKKKGNRYFLDGFREVLKRATSLVRDEKIAPKVTRIFTVWNERGIYPDEFIDELRRILKDSSNDISGGRESYAASRVPTDFSLNSLERKIRECDVIEKSASVQLSGLNTNKIDKIDSHLVFKLKDKKAGEQCCRELTDIENQLKSAVLALEKQAACRTSLVDTLEKCELFYETQKEEVKIVANAYRNFATRVKAVRSKLSSSENSFPSPYPSPMLDAPSPNSDDDLVLPGASSPLPGLQSLLNVFNEERSNKVSSLDKRLSSLMQNLPAVNQLQMAPNKERDKSSSQSVNKTPTSTAQQIPASTLTHPPSAGHPMSQFSPMINSQPPVVPASVNRPPPPIPPIGVHAPPPFVPQQPPIVSQQPMLSQTPMVSQQPPVSPMIRAGQNYYPPPQQPPPRMPPIVNQQVQHEASPDYYNLNHSYNDHHHDHHHSQSKSNAKFAGHHSNQNSMYSQNSASNSVQPIRSVISARAEQQPVQQQPERRDDSSRLPYDPYASVANNTMDSFEPADMDLSDDEEMNRSSNSTRVLKVIETSDDSNYSGGASNLNSSFNKKHSLTSTYSGNNFQPHQQQANQPAHQQMNQPAHQQMNQQMNQQAHQQHHHHSNQSNSSATISLTPHVPPPSLNIPPPQSHHIPAKNSNFNLSSATLNPAGLGASSLNSSALNPPSSLNLSNSSLSGSSSGSGHFTGGSGNLHSNYHNGKPQANSKPYSTPSKSFHHNDRSPRWSNNNHPLTGGTASGHKPSSNNNQYGGSGGNQFVSSTNNHQFSSGNTQQQQFGSGNGSQQSYGSMTGGQFGRSNSFSNNRSPWKSEGQWKAQANKGYNSHQNRSRPFGNNSTTSFTNSSNNVNLSHSNNSSFTGNFGYASNPAPAATSNLTNLTQQPHQY